MSNGTKVTMCVRIANRDKRNDKEEDEEEEEDKTKKWQPNPILVMSNRQSH